MDVLYPYHLVEKELTPKGSPKTFIAKAMSW